MSPVKRVSECLGIMFGLDAYGRIKQSTTNSVEGPGGDCKRKAEGKTDEEELVQVRNGFDGIGDLGAGKGEIEEHDRSNKLS